MPAYDLETTYLGLDGAGGVTQLPVGPDFWQTIDANPSAAGTLVTVNTGEGDWAHWEMHPQGDEVLVLLEGRLSILFEGPDGDLVNEMRRGSTLVVPRGVWHRAVDQSGVRMLFMTYGAGTQHKPVDV